jgi:mono/diheme cytochrome c family protein
MTRPILLRPEVIAVLIVGGVLGGMGGAPSTGGAQPKKLNPFAGNGQAIEEGRTLYVQNGCSGCHGAMGGGGMGVPLIDDVWRFGSDDETLYRLIKGEIGEQTMPKVWTALEDDQVWKLVAYIRALYKGDSTKINW